MYNIGITFASGLLGTLTYKILNSMGYHVSAFSDDIRVKSDIKK